MAEADLDDHNAGTMNSSRYERRFLPTLLLGFAMGTATAKDNTNLLGLEALDVGMPNSMLVAAGHEPGLDLNSLQGRPLLLHFWATWCGPCKREMPLLAGLPEKLRSTGVAVVFIDVDEADQASAVLQFAREAAIEGPVYMALPSGLSSDFWTWGVPVTYLVAPNGRIRGRFLGPRPWDSAAFAKALEAELRTGAR